MLTVLVVSFEKFAFCSNIILYRCLNILCQKLKYFSWATWVHRMALCFCSLSQTPANTVRSSWIQGYCIVWCAGLPCPRYLLVYIFPSSQKNVRLSWPGRLIMYQDGANVTQTSTNRAWHSAAMSIEASANECQRVLTPFNWHNDVCLSMFTQHLQQSVFCNCWPCLWNSLPSKLQDCLGEFKRFSLSVHSLLRLERCCAHDATPFLTVICFLPGGVNT